MEQKYIFITEASSVSGRQRLIGIAIDVGIRRVLSPALAARDGYRNRAPP